MFAVFRSLGNRPPRLAVLAAALLLAACEPLPVAGPTTGQRIDTTEPVPVALLVPSGSGNAGDAALAASLENAARLAASDLQGVRIDLRVYDTAADSQVAAAAASRAVDEGAKIVLGPVYAQAANAAGVAVAPDNVNVLAFSNNPQIAGNNVFVLGNLFSTTADRMLAYARSQGRSRIMIVHGRTVAEELGRDAIRSAAARAGVTVVATASYEFSQQGVVNAIPMIRDEARRSGADTIFFASDTAGALPLLAQLLPESGIDPAQVQFMGLTRWDIPPQTLDLPGVQGGWFALPDPSMAARFRARYASAYGAPPHPIAGLAYDGIAAIGALVAQGDANALTGAALTQGAGFQGVGGVFRLRPDGTNERGLAVAEIRDNQVTVIDPAPRAFGGAGF
jgi:ABC-type branched-subunit amino acid transport system substrate-binding protein